MAERGTSVQLSWNDFWTGQRNLSTRTVFWKLHALGAPLSFASATQGGTWTDCEMNRRPDRRSGVIGEGADMFPIYVEEGMTPAGALNTALMAAARNLNDNWAARLGSIEGGKLADIIAVPGDSLEDIAETMNVGFVIRNDLAAGQPGISRRARR